MSISEKIKALNNKIDQNEAQYNLDRQTAKIFCFIIRIFDWERCFSRKRLSRKSCCIEKI